MVTAPRRRIARIAAIVAAVLAAFAGGVFIFVAATTHDAQKVSDRFVSAAQRDNGAAAYALTSDAFRHATTEQRMSALVDQLAPLVTAQRSIVAKSINASTSYGRIAVFVYRMDARQGGPIYWKTQLSKDGSRWRVMNFRSSRSKLAAKVE